MLLAQSFRSVTTDANLSRSTEKQRLKAERIQKCKRILALFTKIKPSQGHLRHKEYLYFLTLLQLPLHYIVFLFDLVLMYGGALVLGVYIGLLIEIGLPLFMLFVFMGSYCRKGYIRYWQCIPLLKGAGYTIALMTVTPEFINTTCAGLSLLYIIDMFSMKIPWSDCKFERVTNTCVPINHATIEDRDLNCSRLFPTFSALNYFRFNKQNQYPDEYYEKLGPMKNDWAITIAVTWILIFALMVQGFRNFQKIMRILQLVSLLCWMFIFISTLTGSGQYHKRNAMFYGIHPALNIEFWLFVFMHVCDRDDAGSVILLSSLGIRMSIPKIDAVIVYSLKMLVIAVLIFWVPILLQEVAAIYSFTQSECFKITGFEIIFAIIPEVLTRMPLPQLWIATWFLSVYIHSFASVLYTFTGVIDALIDAFPILILYRVHMCVILCTASIGINMLFVTRLSTVLINTWSLYGMVIVRMIVLAMVTFAMTFIYSIPRLVTDYHFAFGEPPAKFWIQSWKITPFLVLFETVFMLYHQTTDRQLENTTATLVLISYITAVIMLLPILIVMLWKYCQHVKYQMISSVVQPEEGWGYFVLSKRVARKHFHPEREVKYKIVRLKCKHQCLQNSRKLRRLQNTHIVRRNSILVNMNKTE